VRFGLRQPFLPLGLDQRDHDRAAYGCYCPLLLLNFMSGQYFLPQALQSGHLLRLEWP